MERNRIRFGLMTDIHQDLMYKASDRLQAFIDHSNKEDLDFIIQLGDFCFPTPENKPFLGIWQQFGGPNYHVLGNHDMDICDKQTIMSYLGMKRNYYSFDCGDYHFIVLDANYFRVDSQYVDYSFGNYSKHADSVSNVTDEQLEWLREDLSQTDKHTILFSHQSLEETHVGTNVGIHNSDKLREILREANQSAGFRKVIACMNGHNHLDGVKVIDDIYFIHMNSISYHYLGPQFNTIRYSEEITEEHPIFRQSVPYEEPIYAIITLEPGLLMIKGKESTYVGPAPNEIGHSNANAGHVVSAKISSRQLKF
ncbi:metallophosphoesterase [Paenibacillus sp. HWE-109]|uniref:metallophosphoesterase family protein n=1 Tax=Paenibacillus sp. HWE-109 TaxID=1306526 RepID=UPI001EE02D6C|nr:metallophosphoesterase [Paenibacillus sp. HWE-109]UKS26972.1 metallophosphoesterase [Paenibacillus sp. HWE-109]